MFRQVAQDLQTFPLPVETIYVIAPWRGLVAANAFSGATGHKYALFILLWNAVRAELGIEPVLVVWIIALLPLKHDGYHFEVLGGVVYDLGT